MKKNLLLSLLLIVSLHSLAQLSMTPDTARLTCINYGDSDIHGDVNNDTGGDISVEWAVIDIYMPTGWKVVSICDNLTCLSDPVIGNSSTSDAFATATAMDMKVTYNLASNAAEGKGFVVIGLTDGTHNATAIFEGSTCGPMSMSQFDSESFEARYHDRTLDIFKGQDSKSEIYRVYNIYGQMVQSGHLDQIVNSIPFDYISSVYILEVLDEDGNRLGTKKFSNF